MVVSHVKGLETLRTDQNREQRLLLAIVIHLNATKLCLYHGVILCGKLASFDVVECNKNKLDSFVNARYTELGQTELNCVLYVALQLTYFGTSIDLLTLAQRYRIDFLRSHLDCRLAGELDDFHIALLVCRNADVALVIEISSYAELLHVVKLVDAKKLVCDSFWLL